MNIYEAQRIWPTMKAFAEGAEIQRYPGPDGEWQDTPTPTFDPEFSWRAKPKPDPTEIKVWVTDQGEPITPAQFHDVGARQAGNTVKLFREVTE